MAKITITIETEDSPQTKEAPGGKKKKAKKGRNENVIKRIVRTTLLRLISLMA